MSSRVISQHLGKYELREKLGHGTVAEVWEAFGRPLPAIISPPVPLILPAVWSQGNWKRPLIGWFLVLLVLAILTIVLLNTLSSGRASPGPPSNPLTSKAVGTLKFSDSGQYDPNTTVGYNDMIALSLHDLPSPQTGKAYFAWLMPDQGDSGTVPLLLGSLSVNAGNSTLKYDSPTHKNLLEQYSGVRITEQTADSNPSIPSPDPQTWRWDGWLPHTPAPDDPKKFSMLSHFRHLLAKDPTLQDNKLSGGLVIWMTRNVGKVQEWSSAAQGSWGDKNPELIHRHMLRMLDYLDGQTYTSQDVPAGSPWLVDPLAGKLGLLSHTQDQTPPGYLQHVDVHLNGLANSPGHTEEQNKVAIQVDGFITRIINDLTQVRKDATQLAQLSNEQLLQPDTLTLLNEMANLTREANSGWFDSATSTNQGGVIWMNARIQQLATISLAPSSRQ